MMHPELEIAETPSWDDRAAILRALSLFNLSHGPPTTVAPLAILIRDEEGLVIGGLWGQTIYDWLAIELVAVPEGMRGAGLGSKLMAKAEAVARERACVGAWLDTFSFQARGFYERLGYCLAGTIDGHPVGGARYILSKKFG